MPKFREMKLRPKEHRSVGFLLAAARRQGLAPLRPPGRWRAEFFIGPLGPAIAMQCGETRIQRTADESGIVCNVAHVNVEEEWVAVIEFRNRRDATAFKVAFL